MGIISLPRFEKAKAKGVKNIVCPTLKYISSQIHVNKKEYREPKVSQTLAACSPCKHSKQIGHAVVSSTHQVGRTKTRAGRGFP
jgi:hypothetical protein